MEWIALSKKKHSKIALKRKKTFFFAQKQILVPLGDFELQTAVQNFPIVFSRDKGKIRLFGLLGLEAGKNLFVDSNGLWKTKFLPASLGTFPFRIGKLKDGNNILLFLEDSEVIVDGDEGEPLFNESGEETEILQSINKVLAGLARSGDAIDKVCLVLDELGLLEPLVFQIKREDGKSAELKGLFRVNLTLFGNLEDEHFIKLRKANALEVIYAHLFSMASISTLVDLINQDGKAGSSLKELGAKIFEKADQEIDFEF